MRRLQRSQEDQGGVYRWRRMFSFTTTVRATYWVLFLLKPFTALCVEPLLRIKVRISGISI